MIYPVVTPRNFHLFHMQGFRALVRMPLFVVRPNKILWSFNFVCWKTRIWLMINMPTSHDNRCHDIKHISTTIIYEVITMNYFHWSLYVISKYFSLDSIISTAERLKFTHSSLRGLADKNTYVTYLRIALVHHKKNEQSK
jgi:hypothetical protein